MVSATHTHLISHRQQVFIVLRFLLACTKRIALTLTANTLIDVYSSTSLLNSIDPAQHFLRVVAEKECQLQADDDP